MITIAIAILALCLFAGVAIFVFKNAMRIILICVVCVMAYVGWHVYLKDKGINPDKALSSLTESVSSASTEALDTAKKKGLEASEIAKETVAHEVKATTNKAKNEAVKAKDKAVDSIKVKTRNAVNEALK